MELLAVVKKSLSFGIPSLIALSAACFLSSCATAKVEISDQRFTDVAIALDKMAIGPVVQVGGDRIKEHEAQSILNELKHAIAKKRDYIDLKSTNGQDLIYRPNSTAEKSLPSSIRSSARNKGARFLLLTELTHNCVSYDTCQRLEEITENILNCDGKVVGTRVTGHRYVTTASTARKVAARYKVLDLDENKTVWVSRSENSNSRQNSSESCICYPHAPAHPYPPSVTSVAAATAKAIVRKLPKQKF